MRETSQKVIYDHQRVCSGNCLTCGKCASLPVLDVFSSTEQAADARDGYGIAIDIGTTTIVLALVDLREGKIETRHSFMNPQRSYGPDVISRIQAANDGCLSILTQLITHQLLTGIKELLSACHLSSRQICDIVIAGNTTMIYLLLGFPCQSLGVLPFKPAYSLKRFYTAVDVLGPTAPACPVRVIPWLAAFIGGDIVAGLLHTLLLEAECFILIDLGTNGEMALYRHGELYVTSTAAGPAFEGAARGGGASGVIHDLAELVRQSTVDETGLLNGEACFSQKQIRDLQLAKSAIRSGLEILLKTVDLRYDALDAVYLAGGIGQAVNTVDAADIGMIPSCLVQKTIPVGNASLGGAVRMLLSPARTYKDTEKLLNAAHELNLAAHPLFNNYFMDYMFF